MDKATPLLSLIALGLLWLAWQSSQTAEAQPETAVSTVTGIDALYAVGGHQLTAGWHGLSGWEGEDWAAGCGTPLYAPISGVVTYVGADGYVGPHAKKRHPVYGYQNSMLTISGTGEEWTLLHLDIAAAKGQRVIAGKTYIGDEAAIGNTKGITGCHTHIVKKIGGRPVRPH